MTARDAANRATDRAGDTALLIGQAAAALGDLDPDDPDPDPAGRPAHPGPAATENQVIFWAQQLEQWLDHNVGPTGELTSIRVGQTDAGDTTLADVGRAWNGTRLNVWPAHPDGVVHLEDLDIDGLLYIADTTRHLELDGVRCRGVQFANNPNCTVDINYCDIGDSPEGVALGQGAINMWGQQGWTINRTRLHGYADGIQAIGDGLLKECIIENLRYGQTTHNDTVQNYGGGVHLDGCRLDSTPDADYHHNGVFQSTATARNTLTESVVTVRGDHRFRNWAGHSNQSKNPHPIVWRSSYVEGILIGNHDLTDGTHHRGPQMTEDQAAALTTARQARSFTDPASIQWGQAW
jgi:hypothetical protein